MTDVRILHEYRVPIRAAPDEVMCCWEYFCISDPRWVVPVQDTVAWALLCTAHANRRNLALVDDWDEPE